MREDQEVEEATINTRVTGVKAPFWTAFKVTLGIIAAQTLMTLLGLAAIVGLIVWLG